MAQTPQVFEEQEKTADQTKVLNANYRSSPNLLLEINTFFASEGAFFRKMKAGLKPDLQSPFSEKALFRYPVESEESKEQECTGHCETHS